MTSSLVGSEMCIRDSHMYRLLVIVPPTQAANKKGPEQDGGESDKESPVSYTHLTLPTICSV
eukprot:2109096-Prorocentrum_lima.AAC.1